MSLKNGVGEAIRVARKKNALRQTELAEKLGVSQGTICNWELGKGEPDFPAKQKLKSILGTDLFTGEKSGSSDETSVLAAWLSKARQEAGMTVAQLAEKSRLSIPTIYGIEAGRAENPRRRTINLHESALGKKFEAEFQEELRESSTIEGIGEFQDFDPYARDDWPGDAGVYVF